MRKFIEDLFDIVNALVKSFFTWDSLSNILFGIRVSKTLLNDGTIRISRGKKKEVLRRIEIANDVIKAITKNMPNEGVSKMVNVINGNQDESVFKDFRAALAPNKHGDGSDGINLSLVGTLLGIATKIL